MTTLAELEAAVRASRSRLDCQSGEAVFLATQGQQKVAEATQLRGQLELHDQVVILLTSIGEKAQQAAQHQIEELVTRALQVVFSENMSFKLVPSVKRDQAYLDFMLVSSYGERTVETPVIDARGGGIAAVVGFVLRLVILLLTRGARNLLVLDETFAQVSESYVPRVAEFCREVADKAGVQILLVTHSTGFGDAADKTYRLVLGSDGVTQVHEGESELWLNMSVTHGS